jgi:hypothetical protein
MAQDMFFRSSSVLLAFTGAAKFYSAAAGTAKILSTQDQFLHVNYRTLMCAVGLVEVGLALFLIFNKSDKMRGSGLLWLSVNFILYRFANFWLGITYCPCLGTLTQKLPLKANQVDLLLTCAVLYWFVGSLQAVCNSPDCDSSVRTPNHNPAAI